MSLDQSLFIRSLKGELTSQAPVWFMRQAGRFLPEYREIRAKHSMLDVIRTPSLAAEVTLQPIRRFQPDAAIIFADILNPLIGMGIELDFVKGSGPKIYNPISTEADVEALVVPKAEDNVGYTLEAIALVAQALRESNTPLIGFAGAPFTLSSYMIEGEGSTKLHKTRKFMLNQQESWHQLQSKLVDLLVDYFVAQVKAGASAVQLFDSWLGVLGPEEYARFVEPYTKQIVSRVKAETDVPFIFFATSCAGHFQRFTELGTDALGVDWRMSLAQAAEWSEGKVALQGNLDPTVLAYAPKEYVVAQTERILEERTACKRGHVFNLGHGIIPDTPIENVEAVFSCIRR